MTAPRPSERGERAPSMAESVRRIARAAGVDAPGLDLVGRALALAMEPRLATLDDEHHPAWLHPGRTALILLRDVAVADPVLLAAAALVESEHTPLRVAPDRIRLELGSEVAGIVEDVPPAAADRLLEDLVAVPEATRLAALAERLDLVRHAHLLPGDAAWRGAVHSQVGSVYLPLAERTDEVLARRYRHWFEAFARRLSRG